MIGQTIGPYHVLAKLGEGGMGEVYRAHDTRLDRDVALKVLPEIFTSDPDRLARFEREAKVLASLNHPNIAQVYGFESNAIAMELVEGQGLDEAIRGRFGADSSTRTALPWALPIVRQIAAALEAAHDQGIIHRDLKPANVKLREDGTVKVLDFGLAKIAEVTEGHGGRGTEAMNSPTLTARATQMGMILGTAAYMAPEQAKGRAVDRRADVWAFGAVFFEMLSGRRAFEGDDVSEVLAAVLKTDPDWSALPADLPSPVTRLLRRCLEKDPKKRLRDIGDAMLQLDDGLASGTSTGDHQARRERLEVQKPIWQRMIPIAATAIVTGVSVWLITGAMAPALPSATPIRFSFQPAQSPLFITNSRRDLAISPDGQAVVFAGIPQQGPPILHVRRFDQPETMVLRGSETGSAPFFSPDNQWVAFIDSIDGSTLRKVPVIGGTPISLGRASGTILGGAWLEDGTIVVGQMDGPLLKINEAGGKFETFTTLEKEVNDADHVWPSAVPGTPLILFVSNPRGRMPLSTGQLAVFSRETGRITRLGIVGTLPNYLSTGHVVYAVENGSLHVVAFDPATISVSGTPVPVLEAVAVKATGGANYDVSRDGRLVYATGGGSVARTLAWTDRTGRETAIAAEPRIYFYARVSPDGKWLSLDVRDQEEDIWIWDIQRENLTRLTDKSGSDQYGLWTANSSRLIFSSTSSGAFELFWHRPDGVGQPEQITQVAGDKLVPFPNAITRDGKQVIYRAERDGKNDLFLVDIAGDKRGKTLLATPHNERNAALSPDDKYMAFESDLSGKLEVYVRPFPDMSRQWPVSVAGGSEPVWAPGGKELFYIAADGQLMSVPVRTDAKGGIEFGKPTPLFSAAAYFFGGQGRNYDVHPDGKRFVMVKNPVVAGGGFQPIHVVINWVDELRARLK